MKKMIDIEKPDLVALTGDMVSGDWWDGTDSFYKNNWNNWTSAFLEEK